MAWDDLLEKDIENRLVQQCRKRGWKAEKFTSPGRRSVPDRIVTKNGGSVFFVEAKRPGEKPTPNQRKDHEARRAMGSRVYVVDTFESITSVLETEDLLE